MPCQWSLTPPRVKTGLPSCLYGSSWPQRGCQGPAFSLHVMLPSHLVTFNLYGVSREREVEAQGMILTPRDTIATHLYKASVVTRLFCGQTNKRVPPFSWRRKWQPTPVFLPGESHGQRSPVGYSPQGLKESDMTEVLMQHLPSLTIVCYRE